MIAIAFQVTLKDGRQIWIPPNGIAFWTDYQPTVALTNEEIEKYLPWLRRVKG